MTPYEFDIARAKLVTSTGFKADFVDCLLLTALRIQATPYALANAVQSVERVLSSKSEAE